MRQEMRNNEKAKSYWLTLAVTLTATLMAGVSSAQVRSILPGGSVNVAPIFNDGFIEHDPSLEVEVWTDNESGVYYEGDEIEVYFRANRDCYVAVYNIDTEGRVNLIYPFDRGDDPLIDGGRIYRIPDNYDDYELLVQGPPGNESIVIVASRTPFPIPDWYDGSDLVADRDRYDFVDFINGRYFGCRSGCPRAVAQVSFVVREWDNYYYRPVYYHPWPVWSSYGGFYLDYYWGSSVYVDGYYYGCAPLYLPRLTLGYHTVTVYDSYGYGWEGSVHIVRDHPVYLDRTIIRTNAGVKSRYRSVRKTGYRNPATSGYPGVKITAKNKPRVKTGMATVTTKTRSKTTVVRGFDSRRTVTGKTSKTVIKKTRTGKGKQTTTTIKQTRGKDNSRLTPYKDTRVQKKSTRISTKNSAKKATVRRKSGVSRQSKSSAIKSNNRSRSGSFQKHKSSSSAGVSKKSVKKSSGKSTKVQTKSSKAKSSSKASSKSKSSGSSKSKAGASSSRSKSKSSSSKARSGGKSGKRK